MAAPTIGHLDPEFIALMDRVQTDLRVLFGTRNHMTLPISGTSPCSSRPGMTWAPQL